MGEGGGGKTRWEEGRDCQLKTETHGEAMRVRMEYAQCFHFLFIFLIEALILPGMVVLLWGAIDILIAH